MDVKTFVVDPNTALAELEKYKSLIDSQRLEEDAVMKRVWKYAAEYPLLNVANVMKEAGRDPVNGLPKLALARADWGKVYWEWTHNGFSSSPRYWNMKYAIKFPEGTFPRIANPSFSSNYTSAVTAVPFIPPDKRPDDVLSRYHILFEVKDWKTYNRDPFLLKQVSGWIYAVVAEWDLTELETMILSGLRKA